MQRIFSTFPGGWPGGGLLLLRCAVAAPLLMPALWSASENTVPLLRWAGAASGGLLLVGLWTPFASAAQVLIEAWRAFEGGSFDLDHLLRAAVGLSLIMLGPGVWSVDARLYGRRRIEVG